MRRPGIGRAGAFLVALMLGGIALAQERPAEPEPPGSGNVTQAPGVPDAAGSAEKPADSPETAAPEEASATPRIRWQPWSRRTFEQSAALFRPVLLYLRAEDCRLCRVMEEKVLNQPEVAAMISEQTIPVAVDADLRPDISQRYVIGLIPTATYLLPNAEPMYDVRAEDSLERLGGYFSNPREFRDYLTQVVAYFQDHPRSLRGKAFDVGLLETKVRAYPAGSPPWGRVEDLVIRMSDGFDFTWGGFGTTLKFMGTSPYRLFRILAATRDDATLARAVVLTADKILAGRIHDPVEGGFHHYATRRDWSVPAWEKRLETNARALRLLTAAAAQEPEREDLRAAVGEAAEFILTLLRLPHGAFAFSQLGALGPDDTGSYFAATEKAERDLMRPPALDTRVVTSANGEAIQGLLEAGALLGREDLEQAALAAADFLAARLYQRGRGLFRYLGRDGEGKIPGLLLDQVSGLEAFLMAYQARGKPGDLERTEDLFRFCKGNLRGEGGFYIDRVEDRLAVGKLRRPLVPLALNGRLALAALRLASLTGKEEYRETGLEILGSLATAVDKMSPSDAPYVEALLAAREAPFRTIIVQGGGADAALRRAALLLPLPGVVTLAASQEGLPELLAGSGGPGEGAPPGAYLCAGTSCVGPRLEPAELLGAALTARTQASGGETESMEKPPESEEAPTEKNEDVPEPVDDQAADGGQSPVPAAARSEPSGGAAEPVQGFTGRAGAVSESGEREED
jgi:uncharacterized protein YyaL (SSP411 family)